jgi:pimeloyl-ACP methyl ester carboxylesterase
VVAGGIAWFLLDFNAAAASDLSAWGVVLLHGKWGMPGRSGGTKGLGLVASALRSAGDRVVAPAMPWAKGGTYLTFDESLAMVGQQVAELRAGGARRVAVVGYSIGGNVAIGYAALRRGIDAVVVMAPGHQPALFAQRTGTDLARAKAEVAAGRGTAVGNYTDVNQGTNAQVRATAAGYVSFFDPNGPASFGHYSGAGGVPLLWVVGRQDGNTASIAAAGGGKTVVVNGTHVEVPAAGAADVVGWLKSL